MAGKCEMPLLWSSLQSLIFFVEHGVGSRRALVELSRDEIEDKHLRLLEENMASDAPVRVCLMRWK